MDDSPAARFSGPRKQLQTNSRPPVNVLALLLCVVYFLQDFLDDRRLGIVPVPRPLEAPAVDDIADEIEFFGLRMFQEIEQIFGLASARAEVRVRNPNTAIPGNSTKAMHLPLP